MTDRELTGDEAQRALSEAMRRTMATVPDPTPAELIAFVREIQAGLIMPEWKQRMFDALLTWLERQQTERRVMPPDCECDGGEQGDGLCAIPHEPYCPRGRWEMREIP